MTAITNSSSAFYERSLQQMAGLRRVADDAQRQISTGERLARSSQDPVASAQLRLLARSERLAEIETLNADNAAQELTASSDALETVADAMIRVRELVLASASDLSGAVERDAVATEIEQLRVSMLALANALSLAGRPLFGGEGTGAAYLVDAAGTASYAGTAASGDLEIAPGTRIERGLTGPEVFDFNDASGPTDVFAFLATLVSDLRGGVADPVAAAQTAVSGIDNSIETLSRAQAVLGARLGWVDTVAEAQVARQEARSEQQGKLGGVDLAVTITRLQQTLNVLEASQASFARLSSLSLFDEI